METGWMAVGCIVIGLLLLTTVGGPMILVDWMRARRADAAARQIALTEALDAQLGPVVAPVVTRGLLGVWEIRLAVPLLSPNVQARMIAIIDECFAPEEGSRAGGYRIVLTCAESSRAGMTDQIGRPATPWPGRSTVAA